MRAFLDWLQRFQQNQIEKMFKEYDIVKARCALGKKVKTGDIGTILLEYGETDGEHFYEVEFLDDNHNHKELVEVKGSNLIKRNVPPASLNEEQNPTPPKQR